MKVLMINGSPHAKGSTWTALHEMEKIFEVLEAGIESGFIFKGDTPEELAAAAGPANNVKVKGAGLAVDTNVLTLITPDTECELPLLTKEEAATLKAGDYVYLTGALYTARDAAHKRMYEALRKGEALPIDIKGQTIYYMGPSPAREGRPIGSAGPTTATRMDKYAPALLDLGLKGMIGKGKRRQNVKDSMIKNGAVYFAAVGGAGAILSKCIRESEVIAYDDLGTEAIRKLYVEDFPAIVVIDSEGNDLYETSVLEYKKE